MMDPGLEDRTEPAESEVFTGEVSSELGSSSDLQTSVVDEREHLQVYLRIRPFTTAESSNGEAQNCVTIESPDTVLVKPPSSSLSSRQSTASTDRSLPQTGQRFQFSQVYGADTTQKQLFDGTVKDLVKDVLTGGNSLVFTYGVTNAGKTFTFLGPDADAGILPRSLATIFNSIEDHVFSGITIKPHRCREFTRLTREQQVEEILFKRNLFKQFKEADRSNTSLLNSTIKTLHEASMVGTTLTSDDRISLEVEEHTKFSIWVSFCEIYNENIHDLLEATPNGSQRRTVLRLSQDIKGNSFVRDLRWVQVNSAEEAYRVLKLGKRNQSFSSTKLNLVSSRSHSIFSIRILKIEDIGTPRVSTISELCLCDLAGSERCAKTQNKGERLKEAGNINSSLLILGKCINALRHNQQAKLLQHVPFRESKLTHLLQSFFCGRGKACMIVNVNQCASMYDETLNVLKFSAVAQKVVVLNTKPQIVPERSSSDVSFVVDNPEGNPKRRRRSSLNVWETSLEDVQEDEDDEYEEEVSLMEDTTQCSSNEEDTKNDKIVISKKTYQSQMALLAQLQVQQKKQLAENLMMEGRIREEISKEFSELFSEMQKDYDDRLAREREILEERAERRLEIFKNLIDKMSRDGPNQDRQAMDTLSAELAEMEACRNCLSLDLMAVKGERSNAFGKMEEQIPPYSGETSTKYEEKAGIMCQLEEKSFQVASLEKQVAELQRRLELNAQRQSSPGEHRKMEQLQQALAAVEKEKRARDEALAALEYQTMGKEEALASLEEERKAREETLTTLRELKQNHNDMSRAFEEEKKSKEAIVASLEAERRAKEEVTAALKEEKKLRQEGQALGQRKDDKMEEQFAFLAGKNEVKQQECEDLHREVKELTAKLEASENKVSVEKQQGEQVLAQLQAAQTKLDKLSSEVKDKTHQIQSLTQEVESLKQELQTSVAASGLSTNLLKDEISELRSNLATEKEQNKRKTNQITQMEKELATAKEQLALEKLMSEEKLKELNEKLRQRSVSKEEVENLRKKLAEKDESMQRPLEDLKAKLELQENEKKQLRAKLQEEKQNSEKVKEKMQEQDANAKKQLEKLQQQLSEQQATSDQLLCDVKLRLYEQEEIADKLRAELELANSKFSAIQDYNKKTNDQADRIKEMEKLLEEKDKLHKEKLAESAKKCEETQKKLVEKEAEVASLQKNLRQVQEQREQEESQAVQETRRREVERRRELLAKAHEAIAQKDTELEKKAEEINRLKESARQDTDKVKSLTVDLQRKEDDSNDLKEKLADYKKQIQQVQKEISSMREEEKNLKQRLSDLEKSKKQLQGDLANRDRIIQQLKTEQSSDNKSEQTQQLYQNARKDLEAKDHVIENMRLALSEQEETQEQMEHVLEQKDNRIQELTNEVEKFKNMLLRRDFTNNTQTDSSSHELRAAKEEAAQATENLKMCMEKHRGERRTWMEEKLSLIGQAKEAEDKRNQEMRKFAEDREKYNRQQSQLESLSSQLAEKEQTMERWRKDRDTLVAALEVQLQKLLSSQAEKDKLIQELQKNVPQPPQEAVSGINVAELHAALSERDAEIQRLRDELKASTAQQEANKQIKTNESTRAEEESPQSEVLVRRSRGRRGTRTSVISQSSVSCPSVLDSSEISTENGRTSRFPKPELEISFSPLQPNRMALRRQGEESSVTVKITRSARKRKSNEMEKEEVEAENRRNTRTKVTPKLTPHQEEKSGAYGRHDSQSSIRSRKEGTLQKIGDFLQSSPTLLGSKAKKMMGLVSGRDVDPSASSSSLSLKAKKNKRKLYRPEISSPMDMPPHPIISREPEVKESDHQIIKRCLRSRVVK